MPNSTPINILIISDGKPGHYNQSLGLAEAMQRLHGAEVSIEQISPLGKGQSLGLLLGLKKLPSVCPQAIKADYIIAAGHRCHLSLLALSRASNAKSVLMMKPSWPLSWFDYCVIPEHDGLLGSDRVLVTKGAVNRIVYRGEKKSLQLILLGGPSKHFKWDEDLVVSQLQQITQVQATQEWQLVTSRRTPVEFVLRLQEEFDGLKLVQPVDVDSNWLASQLPLASHCWVSQDSMSMIYECLTAQAELGLIKLPLAAGDKPNKVSLGVQQLVTEGFIADGIKPATQSCFLAEAERCAGLILVDG